METLKLTDEQMDVIFNCTGLGEYRRPYFKHRIREAGYGAPAETPHEKARRLWEEIDPILNKKYPWGKFDEQIIEMHSAYEEDHAALTAEIDRRDRESWDDADMRYAAYYGEASCAKNGNHYLLDHIINEMLAARRAAKAKE